jgi:hypothetical protein
MSDKTYNGWTNYATWRVNLEVFDGLDPREYFDGAEDVYELSRMLKDFADEVVLGNAEGLGYPASLAYDYAETFLSAVDYYTIAEHMAEDFELFAEEEDA